MSFRCPNGVLKSPTGTRPLRIVRSITLLALFTASLLSCAGRKQGASQEARLPEPPRQTPQTEQALERGVLRVCADPNNLPFSNHRQEGFENKIAELIAREMNLRVEYTWWAQRRGFIRNTLRAGICDIVIGVPSSFELALTTAPYYRSTYAFVYRKNAGLSVRSFDDAVLRNVKIGVQMIGDDAANTPPAHALSNRHIITNVRGYNVNGDYARSDPPAEIVAAVAKGEVDVAVVWGPLAGYFAKRQRVALEVVPVSPEIDLPFLPFVFDISIGVRRGDNMFKDRLEEVLSRRNREIESILDEYGVPRVGVIP
ncbi:MAG TPA: substrate-binding domain-containing protein [Pyrinomonadaceae bacterium]|nr:substrate-binding domain-containing protein [Pyrinomonadaceae bacterium]